VRAGELRISTQKEISKCLRGRRWLHKTRWRYRNRQLYYYACFFWEKTAENTFN